MKSENAPLFVLCETPHGTMREGTSTSSCMDPLDHQYSFSAFFIHHLSSKIFSTGAILEYINLEEIA